MDTKKLRVINYTVPKSCGVCMYGHFVGNSVEGYCGKFQLNIFRYGGCSDGEIRQDIKDGQWGELIDRREFSRNNRHKAKVRY